MSSDRDPMDWHTSGRIWLDNRVDRLFKAWKQTKQGKKWTDKKNPYAMGFTLPDYIHRAIDALNRNDEECFKAIRMIEDMYKE